MACRLITILSCLLPFYLVPLPLQASPGAHGPNGEHLEKNSNNTNNVIGRQADGAVLMPMKHQALLGITTQFATVTSVNKHIQLDGLVKPHPDGYAVIQPSSDGRLDAPAQGMPKSGSVVKAGDILGYIRYQYTAFDLATQSSELVSVRNQIEQTYRDAERLRTLGDLASRQRLEQLETALLTYKQQEQVLQQGLEKQEPLVAPISGVLVNNSVTRGQWVEAGKTLYEIVSPDKFVIEATTSDLSVPSKLVSGRVEQLPELEFSYLGHSPAQVNGLIHVNFENRTSVETSGLLLNQNVTLQAPIDESIEGIVLPANAVVLSANNLPQVWIKLSAEHFLPQLVQYQTLEPGFVVITKGLGSDNRVVVAGASLLNQVR